LSLLVVGGVCLLVAIFIDVATGPGHFTIQEVLDTLFNHSSAPPTLKIVVWDLRLPIACLAVLVGAMLSVAGAQMQTILNNPLADPFTLGISSAASFGAALAIVFGGDGPVLNSEMLVVASAFGFSLLTTMLLYLFTSFRGASAQTMVLVGIALLFTFNALLALLQYNASDVQLSQIIFWMMGSLGKADWTKVSICTVVFVLCLPVFLIRIWSLTAFRMGDDKAASLGVNVARIRIEVLLVVSLLAATAVAFVGTIAFVGLVGPHIARMLVGEDQRFFLPMSVVAGALLMSVTSILSKSMVEGVVYPVGIVTSLIGIPFFLGLVLRHKGRNW
jgi:iron complex transport system permease protein